MNVTSTAPQNTRNTPRPLTADEMGSFQAARVALLEKMPYMAAAAFAIKPIAVSGLGTFACDKHWRVYLDPELLTAQGAWTFDDVVTGVAHELGHLLRDNFARSEAHGVLSSEAALWNSAADAPINDDLREAGLRLLTSDVTAASLGMPAGEATEWYFEQLKKSSPPHDPNSGNPQGGGENPEQGSGQGGTQPGRGAGHGSTGHGCGSGAGQPVAPWEMPEDGPLAAVDQAKASSIMNTVALAIKEHAAKNRGTTPAGWERWAADRLTPSKVSWQRVLRSTARRGVARKAGQVDYTYSRPSRRTGGGEMGMPSLRAPQPTVAVVLDTSGSMGIEDLRAAVSEVAAVSKQLGIRGDNLVMVQVDAAVAAVNPVFDIRKIAIKGGGGTDMRVGIDTVAAMRNRPDVCVVATDCYTPWPEHPIPGMKIVVAAIGHSDADTVRKAHQVPDFMTVVAVPASGK